MGVGKMRLITVPERGQEASRELGTADHIISIQALVLVMVDSEALATCQVLLLLLTDSFNSHNNLASEGLSEVLKTWTMKHEEGKYFAQGYMASRAGPGPRRFSSRGHASASGFPLLLPSL